MSRLAPIFALLTAFGSSAVAQPADTLRPSAQAEALFVRALTERYLEDHEQAATLFERVLAMQPGEPAVLAALAETYEALGEPLRAQSYAEEAAAAAPEPPYLFLLARLQDEAGMPDAALATYEQLLAAAPTDAEALEARGRLQERTGRHAEAAATYERLLASDGADLRLLLRLDALYRRLGDEDAALATLEKAASAFPTERTLLFRLGLAYREAERAADAVGAFERLVAAHPDDTEAVLLLASALDDMGETERAEALRAGSAQLAEAPEERLRQAALRYAQRESDPNAADEALRLLEPFEADEAAPVEALLMLGSLLFDDGEFSRAGDVLDRALAEDPRHLDAWCDAASAALRAGEPARAERTVEEALLLFPGQVSLLRLQAYAFAHQKKPREALRPVDEALGILEDEHPNDVKSRIRLLSLRGLMRAELGEDAAAYAAFEDALKLDADNALVLNNYAYILAERGARLRDALDMAERAVASAPENSYFLDTLGWVFYKLGRLTEAADAVERAIAADDGSALLYDHLGDIYEAQGDRAAARNAWQRALDLEPENEALRRKIEGR